MDTHGHRARAGRPANRDGGSATLATAAALVIESPHVGACALGCRRPDGCHSGAAVAEHSTQLTAPPTRDTGHADSQAAPPSSAGGGPPPAATVAPRHRSRRHSGAPEPVAPGPSPKARRRATPSAPVAAPSARGAPVAACATERRARRCLELVAPRRAAARRVDRASERSVVRVRVRIANDSASAVNVGIDRNRTRLADERGTAYQVMNRGGAAESAATVAAGQSIEQSIDFAVPDGFAGSLQLTLVPASANAARFPASRLPFRTAEARAVTPSAGRWSSAS